jgi:hypothetical protein
LAPELKPQDPQHIVDMIDNEGWPDALGWLVRDDFGDEELNQLVYDATQAYGILNGYEKQIRLKCEELGVDWYIG